MSDAVALQRGEGSGRAFYGVLSELGYRSYAEYLASPLWRSIRQRVYAAKGRVCVSCDMDEADEIHHDRYDRDTLMGKTLKHLRPLCRHCHEIAHGDALWARLE